jgi:hypothetical protein
LYDTDAKYETFIKEHILPVANEKHYHVRTQSPTILDHTKSDDISFVRRVMLAKDDYPAVYIFIGPGYVRVGLKEEYPNRLPGDDPVDLKDPQTSLKKIIESYEKNRMTSENKCPNV